MADELTPQEQRELDAIDRALSGRAVDPELEGIAALANELRDARATPDPDYAAELDRRAAAWLGEGAKPRRRGIPWLRVAIPAAAAAAAAIAVVAIGGGDESEPQLALKQVQEQPRSSALAAPQPESDSSGGAAAPEGEAAPTFSINGLRVSYTVFSSTQATVRLGDQEETLTLEAGTGTIEISTEDYEPGEYELEVTIGSEAQTATVQVG